MIATARLTIGCALSALTNRRQIVRSCERPFRYSSALAWHSADLTVLEPPPPRALDWSEEEELFWLSLEAEIEGAADDPDAALMYVPWIPVVGAS